MKMRPFSLAKKLSEKSTHHKYKHGAVLMRKNRVLSIGFNQNKTHSRSLHAFKHIHAETDALLSTKVKDLSDAVMYIYREDKDGNPALSRPCSSCLRSLKNAGIKKIYYSIDNGYLEENI